MVIRERTKHRHDALTSVHPTMGWDPNWGVTDTCFSCFPSVSASVSGDQAVTLSLEGVHMRRTQGAP
jgi:hypothetical protein